MKGGHAGVIQVKAEVQDPTTVQRTTEQDCVGTPTEDASSPKASDTSDKAEDKTKEEGQASTPGGDQDVIKQEAASAARPGANPADSKQAVSLASPKQVVLRPASAQAIDWRRPVSMVAHLKKGGQKWLESRFPDSVQLSYTSLDGATRTMHRQVLGTGKAKEPRVALVAPGAGTENLKIGTESAHGSETTFRSSGYLPSSRRHAGMMEGVLHDVTGAQTSKQYMVLTMERLQPVEPFRGGGRLALRMCIRLGPRQLWLQTVP